MCLTFCMVNVHVFYLLCVKWPTFVSIRNYEFIYFNLVLVYLIMHVWDYWQNKEDGDAQ
jgi:hypothetical protein